MIITIRRTIIIIQHGRTQNHKKAQALAILSSARPKDMLQWLKERQITGMSVVPSHLRSMAQGDVSRTDGGFVCPATGEFSQIACLVLSSKECILLSVIRGDGIYVYIYIYVHIIVYIYIYVYDYIIVVYTYYT